MLAKEGCHMSIKLSDVYSSLEKVCLEGTCDQSKLVVSAIAALACTSEQFVFSKLCKPLFVTVQALVSEMLFDGNLRHKYIASLYLRSIFNAIKRAGDAVDAQMTLKLHLLAEVGISILDSLNINNTPGPHTPGLVLLPSSLYKSGPSEMREANAYSLIGCKADAIFTKKLVSRLKFEVSGIVWAGTKHSQQFYENSLRPSSARPRTSNSKSGDKDNLLINKTKEQIVELHTGQNEQFDTRGQENPAMPSHIRSVVLNDKFSAENKHERDAHGKPTLSQNEVIESCSREEDTVNKCDSSCAGPSKLSRDGDQVKCFTSKGTQIVKSNGETLVGKRIKLWSPIEKCYNSGVVDGFNSAKSTHQITYKSGEVDTLSLDSETWEIDMDELQARYCNDSGDTSANAQAKLLDSKQENLLKKRDNCIRKISQPVKRTKRNEEALGTSISEVIDMNSNDRNAQKTRRRKV